MQNNKALKVTLAKNRALTVIHEVDVEESVKSSMITNNQHKSTFQHFSSHSINIDDSELTNHPSARSLIKSLRVDGKSI
jgi:hypothetical protein